MNDTTLEMAIDQLLSAAGADVVDGAVHDSLEMERLMINALSELDTAEWPDDAIGDRLINAVRASLADMPSVSVREPAHQRAGRRRPPSRQIAVVVAVAALVAAAVVVPLFRHHSPMGPEHAVQPQVLQMKLLASESSPFQSVGADPGAFYLQCITDSICYGTSGSLPTGGSEQVYRTVDGGESWQATAPLPDGLVAPLSCVSATTCMAAVTGPPTLNNVVANPLPIATTTDGGAHWAAQSLPLPGTLSGAQITTASCATETQCVVFVTVQAFPSGTPQPKEGTFFTTSDGGATWSQDAPVPAVLDNGLYSVQCASDGTCIGVILNGSAGHDSTLSTLRSFDFGHTWSSEPPTPLVIGGGEILISCSDTTHCMVAMAATQRARILLASTADGGATWRVAPAPNGWDNQAESLSCPSATDCFLSTTDSSSSGFANPVIEATSDDGLTWTTLGLPTVDGTALGSVQPLSCPTVDGCLGVASKAGLQAASLLVSSLPKAS